MALTSVSQVFFVGVLGGVLLELVHWWNLRRRNPGFPQYAKSALYWVVTVLMALAGGILAVLYFGGQSEAIIVLHVGLSAPLMVQKLATTMAEPGARSLDARRLTDFFSW